MKPVVIVNFKTYKKGTGERALKLAKVCNRVAEEFKADVRLAVQPTDIRTVNRAVNIPVYAQSLDPITFGSNTGGLLPEALKEAGAEGTLLNHSECRKEFGTVEKSIQRCKEVDLKAVICAPNAEEGEKLSELNPEYTAVEPPELIGGDTSVSTAKPGLIEESVKRSSSPLLVGAGVKNREDVRTALELGAEGVLIASGVIKADEPLGVLKNLTQK